VSVGAGHTCAIKGDAGDLLCWGQNQLGQVGDGMTQPLGIPYRIGRGYAHVAAGDGFTCAVDREGSVSCWGQNHVGQLGLGGGDRRLRRVPTRVPVADAIDAIAAGSGHACALTRDQRILCWGDNTHGELGVGDTEPRDTPVPVTAPDHGWVTVSAGADHTCALGTDGAFRCWGGNRMGALGDGTGDDQPLPTEIHLSR
jgi:alpha-tubulin suppressor-like RCC1 family protein